jgi:hypothetical protein
MNRFKPFIELGKLILDSNSSDTKTQSFKNLQVALQAIIQEKTRAGDLIHVHGPDEMAQVVAILIFFGLIKEKQGSAYVAEYGSLRDRNKYPERYSSESVWKPFKYKNSVSSVDSNKYTLDKLFEEISKSKNEIFFLNYVGLYSDTRNIEGHRDYSLLDKILQNRLVPKTIVTWGHSNYNGNLRYKQSPLQSIENRSNYGLYVEYREKEDTLMVWEFPSRGRSRLLFTMNLKGDTVSNIIPYIEPVFQVTIQKPDYFTVGDIIQYKKGNYSKLMKIEELSRFNRKSSKSRKFNSISFADVKEEQANSSENFTLYVTLINTIDDGSSNHMSLTYILPKD